MIKKITRWIGINYRNIITCCCFFADGTRQLLLNGANRKSKCGNKQINKITNEREKKTATINQHDTVSSFDFMCFACCFFFFVYCTYFVTYSLDLFLCGEFDIPYRVFFLLECFDFEVCVFALLFFYFKIL